MSDVVYTKADGSPLGVGDIVVLVDELMAEGHSKNAACTLCGVTPEVLDACAELWELRERAAWEDIAPDGWPTGRSRLVMH